MSKLYFLVPVVLWGVAFFTFPFAGRDLPNGGWWFLTNLMIGMGMLITLVVACSKNFDW